MFVVELARLIIEDREREIVAERRRRSVGSRLEPAVRAVQRAAGGVVRSDPVRSR